jgi:alkylation response protein AidB-like acyl-CoA dehydrogenase
MTELATEPETGLDETGLDELAAVAGAVARDRAAGWERWAGLGWLSLLVPEERDGAGADERAAAVVARELGRACRREPYVAAGVLTTSCLAALPALPGSNGVDELLAEVMGGERLTVLAWQPENGAFEYTDPSAGTSANGRVPGGADAGTPNRGVSGGAVTGEPPVRARRDGDRIVLDGVACWIPTTDAATYVVAASETDGGGIDGLSLIRVDKDIPGTTVHSSEAADGTSYARLGLSGAVLPSAAVLARGEAARGALQRAVDTAALITAAELLGLIDRMLELTLEYLASRQQFGRPIGTFQVLQHRAVDMWVQQRLAEAALEGALRRVTAPNTGATMRAKAASSAKSRASSAALTVANEAVQLHGAIGFTDEYELGGYVNRAMVLAAWLGNARAHTRRHGRLVSR